MHDKLFARQLLDWYDENKRTLPWRTNPSPYHTWLSEIMLQQTRVEAVIGYFTRFITALPSIEALASAEEAVYMKLWEGLGYYSRVRNLHKGAKQVMVEYGGKLPETYEELLKISGIGPYTAAAISSIAFNKRIPAIDGNLLRLFARLGCYKGFINENEAKKQAYAYFQECMPSFRCGDFNQALMDLGAGICLANGVPRCQLCPLQSHCQALEEGNMLEYPKRAEKKKRKVEKYSVFLLHDTHRIALCKRPETGLLANLYEFPNVEKHFRKAEASEYLENLGLKIIKIQKSLPAKHIFTHKEWHMQAYLAEVAFINPPENFLLCKMDSVLSDYAIPSAFQVYKKVLEELTSQKEYL